MLRKFSTIRRRAGVGQCTLHDPRRSCITNWAKHGTGIHVVQQLAGHADIKTTQEYYLSVQDADILKAQAVQAAVLGQLPAADLTDPKVTHSGKKRVFPGRQGCQPKKEALGIQGLGALRETGLEPVTFGSVDRCSIQLSYSREFKSNTIRAGRSGCKL